MRKHLNIVLNKHKHIVPEISKDFSKCSFNALPKNTTKSVESTIKIKTNNSNLRITTIHQVKGETLDATMVVSSPDKRGATKDGHWTNWLEDSTSEKARLAYVASSRPKHLLIWAVPDASSEEKDRLCELGFSIIDLSS